MFNEIFALQRWIYGAITADLDAFAVHRSWISLAAVLPAGILFGAVHAMTPGHGKSILASYLLGSRLASLRALGVATVLALTHVGTAVLIAVLALPLVTRTLVGAGQAPAVELLSRGLLVGIGLWLIVRAWRGRTHPHGEGVAVGFIAGLVPCPLTLIVMFYALSRGVPEAGLTFASAMALGVLCTLAAVALLTVLGRDWVVALTARYGASVDKLARVLDGVAGGLVVVLAMHEVWK